MANPIRWIAEQVSSRLKERYLRFLETLDQAFDVSDDIEAAYEECERRKAEERSRGGLRIVEGGQTTSGNTTTLPDTPER